MASLPPSTPLKGCYGSALLGRRSRRVFSNSTGGESYPTSFLVGHTPNRASIVSIIAGASPSEIVQYSQLYWEWLYDRYYYYGWVGPIQATSRLFSRVLKYRTHRLRTPPPYSVSSTLPSLLVCCSSLTLVASIPTVTLRCYIVDASLSLVYPFVLDGFALCDSVSHWW